MVPAAMKKALVAFSETTEKQPNQYVIEVFGRAWLPLKTCFGQIICCKPCLVIINLFIKFN